MSLIASAERELDQFPDVVQSMSDMRKSGHFFLLDFNFGTSIVRKKDLVKKRDQWNEGTKNEGDLLF